MSQGVDISDAQGVKTRVCATCGEAKPLATGFYLNPTIKSGYPPSCRECVKARARARYYAKRDEILAQGREYFWRNRERFREYERSPARLAVQRERARRFREEHPQEEAARVRRSCRSYQARKAGAFVEQVDALVVLERDDGRCGICGGDVDPASFHVDHIVPLSRGGLHNYENSQVAHPSCNQSKGSRLPEGATS